MAATIAGARVLLSGAGSEGITQSQLSLLTAGLTEVVPHIGPTGCIPHAVHLTVLTPPTDNSPVFWSWTNSTAATTNVNIKFDTVAGGSLDGAVVIVQCRFLPVASGGQSTITTL